MKSRILGFLLIASAACAKVQADDEPRLRVAAGVHYTCSFGGTPSSLQCRGYLASCLGGLCEEYPRSSSELSHGVNTKHSLTVRGVVTHVAAGPSHACALTDAKEVWCWGPNRNGERGFPGAVDLATPTRVPLYAPARHVAVGTYVGCAILEDNRLLCWGALAPATPDLPPVAGVASGDFQTCAWTSDGVVYCWRILPASAPAIVAGVTARSVAVGAAFACAMTANDRAVCWGRGTRGELGSDGPTTTSVPREVSLPGRATALFAGRGHACAIVDSASLYCWGSNYNGQLGDGTRVDRPVPVRTLDYAPTSVALGGSHSCATRGDEIWCWGASGTGAIDGISMNDDDFRHGVPEDSTFLLSPTRIEW
jgi:alpha-tubulin suppressor-like RCC1 family protein